jgi:transposase-like protein
MKQTSKKQGKREAVVELEPTTRAIDVGVVELDVRATFREVLLEGGLRVAAAMFEEELVQLCGRRYERKVEGQASRWGRQKRDFVLGGRKVTLEAPRARKGSEEVVPTVYEGLQREDPLSERAVEQMVIGVSTRKYARSLEPVIPNLEASGTSKSAVSRRFVARTKAQLEVALARPLGERRWAAIMVDGITFHEHVILIALGIDEEGHKHLLGLRQGTTENATVCRELLADLVARGVPADKSIVVVIDGGKGLRKATTEVFGENAMVQRCQVHKKRNVLDHLPEHLRPQVSAALSQAWGAESHLTAIKQLKNLAATLEADQPSAASSLREGLEETLTVKQLGVTGRLARTLETTNPIENLNGGVRRVAGRVKRCRNGSMARRWVATAALEAAKGFRRVRGHRDIPKLIAALNARDAELQNANVRRVG